MKTLFSTLAPVFLLLIGFALVDGGISAEYAEAKSFKGGRMFKSAPSYKKSPTSTAKPASQQKKSGGSFSRGLMGGLLGGALGGLLFGSMFGGEGIGILPILLLAGAAFFIFRKFSANKRRPGFQGNGHPSGGQGQDAMFGGGTQSAAQPPPMPTPDIGSNLLEEGLAQIRQTDRDFDPHYFTEVASDVFFQVQAGWMRRDLDSYRHLLGEQLAQEYAGHFADMEQQGRINKLESIAVRNVEVIKAGSDGNEDFVTVLFTASLLDYWVDDKNGELLEGSMTSPVKFREEWTWARSVGTQDWKLEGIQ